VPSAPAAAVRGQAARQRNPPHQTHKFGRGRRARAARFSPFVMQRFTPEGNAACPPRGCSPRGRGAAAPGTAGGAERGGRWRPCRAEPSRAEPRGAGGPGRVRSCWAASAPGFAPCPRVCLPARGAAPRAERCRPVSLRWHGGEEEEKRRRRGGGEGGGGGGPSIIVAAAERGARLCESGAPHGLVGSALPGAAPARACAGRPRAEACRRVPVAMQPGSASTLRARRGTSAQTFL